MTAAAAPRTRRSTRRGGTFWLRRRASCPVSGPGYLWRQRGPDYPGVDAVLSKEVLREESTAEKGGRSGVALSSLGLEPCPVRRLSCFCRKTC